ncbi:MAG: hypothetical protein LAO05_15215 [Acidobacteriia bacterium]|nr:hypothetical protein [Terriglobia bacterium]
MLRDVPASRIVEEELADAKSEPVNWLRENGRYLSPNGGGDMLVAGTAYLRNLVAVHVVIFTAVLAVFLLVNAVRAACAGPWHQALGSAHAALVSLGQRLPDFIRAFAAWPIRLLPSEHTIGDTSWIWWSPTVDLALLVSLVFVVPLGATYWLAQGEPGRTIKPWHSAAAMTTMCLVGLQAWPALRTRFPAGSVHGQDVLAFVTFVLVAALIWYAGFSWNCRALEPLARQRKLRRLMSSCLATAVGTAVGLGLFALIDSLGQTLYATVIAVPGLVFRHPTLFAPLGVLLALVAYAKKITSVLVGKLKDGDRIRLRWDIVATALAGALLGAYLVAAAAVAHGFLWNWQIPASNPGGVLASHFEPQDRLSLSSDHHIVVNRVKADPSPSAKPMSPGSAVVAFVLALLASFIFGRTLGFINLSSHHALYSQRLARAYLGATNPKRWWGKGLRVTDVMADDDASLIEYSPHRMGGSLHIVNTTLNETVAGKSNIEERDRKGMPLAIGPCGLSVGTRYHAVWKDSALPVPTWKKLLTEVRERSSGLVEWVQRIFGGAAPGYGGEKEGTHRSDSAESQPVSTARKVEAVNFDERVFHLLAGRERLHSVEDLPVSSWLGISGAAFTTGLGSRTSIGFSLLLGLTGVRLGYWWDSQIAPGDREASAYRGNPGGATGRILARMFPVQSYLVDELLARFHGPARQHWYLSDGGHFENTGCYELIRRRIPMIVCCDCGADSEYEFGDLANLVRKVRTDFDAEMAFLPESTGAHRKMIGSLDSLRRARERGPTGVPMSRCHATVARVSYRGDAADPPGRASTILFLKPTLTGDESLDLLAYARGHPSFPQEGTADQFFDEAQWESYRRLGEHIADQVLGQSSAEFFAQFARWRGIQSG